MHENSAGPAAFWASVANDVTSRVEPVLVRDGKARASVIEYLRDLEAVALRDGSSREALQVIDLGPAPPGRPERYPARRDRPGGAGRPDLSSRRTLDASGSHRCPRPALPITREAPPGPPA